MPNYDNDNHHGSPWYKFRDNTIKIVVKEGITATGNYAFESSSNLITVELPKSLIAIGDRTFHDCNRLAVIDIPDGVIKVGAYSFYNCVSLHSIVLPKGINVIERGAFQYCRGLESIDIPDEVVNIEYEAFYGCHGLLSVILPDGLKSIGDNAFNTCLNLPSITLPKGLAWIGDKAFAGCESLASITIPAGVTTIGREAFRACRELGSVYIHSTTANLVIGAFGYCTDLKDMTVSWIRPPKEGYGGFFENVDLSKATLHVPKGRKAAYAKADHWKNFGTIVEDGGSVSSDPTEGNFGTLKWAYDAGSKTLTLTGTGRMEDLSSGSRAPWHKYMKEIQSVSVQNGIANIGDHAFDGAKSLTGITLPASVKQIGEYAFNGCSQLATVGFPSQLNELGSSAFAGCESLTTVSIPAGLSIIRSSAFRNCTGLTAVTLPAGVSKLEKEVFENCTNLKDVTLKESTPPQVTNTTFRKVPFLPATLHVPAGAKTAYSNAIVWKSFGKIEEEGGAVTPPEPEEPEQPSQPEQPGEQGELKWPSNITNDPNAGYYVSSITPAMYVQPVNGDTPCPNGNFTAYGRNNLVAGAVVETGGTVCIVIKPVNNTGKFAKSGTAYIKQGDVCGTPLSDVGAIVNYAAGADRIVLRFDPGFTYGSRTYVPMIKTAGGERFYTRPITITCKAKVGHVSNPAVTLQPKEVTAGQGVEARGDMFTKNGSVKVEFQGSTTLPASTFTADASGRFVHRFTLPATAKSGVYAVTFTDLSTNKSIIRRFQVPEPQTPSTPTPTVSALKLVSPTESKVLYSGESLSIAWKDAVNLEADRKNGGRKYKIEVSINGGAWKHVANTETDHFIRDDGETFTRSYQYDPETNSLVGYAPENPVTGSVLAEFNFKLRVKKVTQSVTEEVVTTESMTWKAAHKLSEYPVLLEWDRTNDSENTPSGVKLNGVAADGVARLRIALPKQSNGNVISGVEVLLTDDKGSNAPNLLGSVVPCKKKPTGYYEDAKEVDYSLDFIKTTSSEANEDGYFRFWYRAPEDFSRGAQDNESGKRIVYAELRLRFTNGKTATVRREIEIVRPPLMLVHGLNGDAGTWDKFRLYEEVLKETYHTPDLITAKTIRHPYMLDKRFLVAVAPNMEPRSHFKLNADHLLDKSTNDKSMLSVICQMRRLGYACNQVDYICHSMGGCILRYAEETPNFYRNDNYQKGFVHKFITLHTPHNGSSFADLLCNDNFSKDLITSGIIIGKCTGYLASKIVTCVGGGVVGLIATPHIKHYIDNTVDRTINSYYIKDNDSKLKPASAVMDLRYKDGVKFHDTPLASHLIVGGFNCSDEGTTQTIYRGLLSLMNLFTDEIKGNLESCTAFNDYFSQNGLESDFMAWNDGIVSVNSQLSAPPKSFNQISHLKSNMTFWAKNHHLSPTNSFEVGKRVNELLNASLSSPLFNSIPATNNLATTRRASTETKPRLRSAEPGKVKIESPGVGDTYRPGETVTVKIKVDTENLAGLFLSFQDQVVEVESPISEMVVRMQVGDEQTETQEIQATALYRTGQEMAIGSDSRTVIVKSPDNATSLEVSPRTLVMEKGTSRRPEYTALYTGSRSELGNTPDLAVTIDNPAIASYDAATNTFKGLSAGKTYAVATWRGLTRTFVVDVMEDVTPPSDPVEDPTPTPTPTPTPSPSPSTPATPPVASNIHPTAVTIEPSSIALSEGKTATLKAVVTPANASSRAVSWSTSDASVATVDNLGLVTALKSGTATITATTNDGGLKATCSVTVTNHVGNLAVPGGVSVWSSAGRLHVQSPAKETIEVFDFAGKLLLRADKPAGEAVYNLDMPAGVTIVKGSSGWTRKVKN